jgi:hypothetical protein
MSVRTGWPVGQGSPGAGERQLSARSKAHRNDQIESGTERE